MLKYCQLLPPILSVIRKMYCSCLTPNRGEITGLIVPVNYSQLVSACSDLKWLQAALTESGTITPGTLVTSVEVTPFGPSSGFYSELAKLTITYSTADDPLAVTDAIVKFLPTGFDKRLVLDLVELPKAEVLCYHYLLRNHGLHGLPALPVPTPRLVFADHCPRTNNALLIMERVPHTLGDQTLPDSLPQLRASMSSLADLHSHFWGGASGRPQAA